MPFFSVIIPNYNHASFLRQRIESVLNQTFTDFEIILLDDGSTDDSIKILEEYKTHEKVSHLVINKRNSGSLIAQWRSGIQLAKAEWIWIAESDDLASPYFLEEFSKIIMTGTVSGILYCNSLIADAAPENIVGNYATRKNNIFSTRKWDHAYCKKGIDEINECLKFDCTINNMSAAVFNKSLASRVLENIPPLRYYADWFFFITLSLNAGICYTPASLNTYRQHSTSLLNADTSLILSKREYFEILKLLYRSEMVNAKKRLITHFSFNYLSFGLKKGGFRNGFRIIKSYLKSDIKLALQVIVNLIAIKLSFEKYKAGFELKINGDSF